MTRVYPFSAYDKFLALKPGPGFWLTLVFVMRPYLIVTISLANPADRMAGINMIYGDRSILAVTALASLLAFPLVYALAKRRPNAPSGVRWLWKRGAWFLMVALCTNLLALGWLLYTTFPNAGLAHLVQAFIALTLCIYTARSRRMSDTFADFPKKTGSEHNPF